MTVFIKKSVARENADPDHPRRRGKRRKKPKSGVVHPDIRED